MTIVVSPTGSGSTEKTRELPFLQQVPGVRRRNPCILVNMLSTVHDLFIVEIAWGWGEASLRLKNVGGGLIKFYKKIFRIFSSLLRV